MNVELSLGGTPTVKAIKAITSKEDFIPNFFS
jgi:hypothetical protein